MTDEVGQEYESAFEDSNKVQAVGEVATYFRRELGDALLNPVFR